MLPAQQGFAVGDGAAVERELGLIDQVELAPLQRAAQFVFEEQPASRAGIHFVVEEAKAPLAFELGSVQRDVGVLEQLLATLAVLGGQRHPDAGADAQPHAVDLARVVECFDQPVGRLLGRLR